MKECGACAYSRLKIDHVAQACVKCSKVADICHTCEKVCSVCTRAVVVCSSCMESSSLVFFCKEHECIGKSGMFDPFLVDKCNEDLLKLQKGLKAWVKTQLRAVELKPLRSECWKHIHRMSLRLRGDSILTAGRETKSSLVRRCRSCGKPTAECSKVCFDIRLDLDVLNGLDGSKKRKRGTSEDRFIPTKKPLASQRKPVYRYKRQQASDGSELRTVEPYLHTFETFAKRRWIGMEILHLFNTEFGANPPSYHKAAITLGLIIVNGAKVPPTYKLKDGDAVAHIAHMHEPPVSYVAAEEMIVGETEEVLAVNKPASMPVHPCGAYRANSLTVVLESELGRSHDVELKPLHRIDRLTSGLVLFAKTKSAAKQIGKVLMRLGGDEAQSSSVSKQYLARVHGRFPVSPGEMTKTSLMPVLSAEPSSSQRGVFFSEEHVVTVSCRLRCADQRQGEWECTIDKGKPSRSRFKLLSYSAHDDSSLVLAEPLTGRTHQLRLHLREMGYPIVNDPNYGREGNLSQERLREEAEVNGVEDVVTDLESLKENNNLEQRAKGICRYCTQNGAASAFKKLQLRWQGICLHAFKYEFKFDCGKALSFETPYPSWAK